jgi:hypothetical protein
MLGEDIKEFFTAHPVLNNHFKGVYAADEIGLLKLQNRNVAVINTDRLSGSGQHWYLVARLEGKLELFDSLGVSEETVEERLRPLLRGPRRACYFNTEAVQPPDSKNCGWYACYWASMQS